MTRRWSATLATLCVATAASAQAPPPAEAPMPSPGDAWVFRSVDVFTEIETGHYAWTFLRRDAATLSFRGLDLKTGEASTLERNYALGRCERSGGVEVCADAYRFPLAAGRKHGYQDMPLGEGRSHDRDCTVEAFEKVTVPAGTFDAWRVECRGRWTRRTSDFHFRGRIWDTHWYAPAVHQEVRAIYRAYPQSGAIDVYFRHELVEFRPAAGAAGRPSLETLVQHAPPPELPATFQSGTTRFAGRFVQDMATRTYSGEGRVVWANGDAFDGQVRRGAREGRGVFVWAGGQRYEGEWKDDKPHGRGRITFVSGDRYEGEVVDGMPHGEGVFEYAAGGRYAGALVAGVPQGRGRLRAADGQLVEGEWRAGKSTGVVSIVFANGDRYAGEVEGDVPNGEGRLAFASGDIYTGRFAAGRPHGEGFYAWASGDRYEGAWKEGRKHGQGRLTFANGHRWEGRFENDERTEQGVLTRRQP